ncbi:MAG: 30S ribosomal protein S13 [Candidatus Colwellbacteria bacterium CG10_big_fil_rev_8_21_14_0_10_41_28]|uniref:Small ribosomal subunit protein uS13 n=1 Tax=Candidatus Colwellbacteria bacterium CG10_big_fil_rev_8_21_14_0_10_41_28 TaxID=1974539 RepID=A0A2H0VHQ9_9BACT|nr:MAG: 30S ribosomal protein S13 [Candidatus Colwellbacteria bacterium CG10_big_fil_rev_8_21_14_0_10_41_28]
MRLFGVNIPDEKRVEIALTYVHGIGQARAEKLVQELGFDKSKRTKDLSQDEMAKIKTAIESKYKIEGELRQDVRQDINRLKNIKSYKGIRHSRRLPVRGQSTKRNSRTIRGNVRNTMGSGRRKLTLK